MTKTSDNDHTPGLKRREFLSVGALPLAAAMGVLDFSGRHRVKAARSRQDVIRVGLIGAAANVRNVQIPGFRRISGVEIEKMDRELIAVL